MSLLFDTFVQKMKYNVLREVAKLAYNDELTPQRIMDISTKIIPEGKPMFRCCIYKPATNALWTGYRSPPPAEDALPIAAWIIAPGER